ncbi:MAG TPA: PAS domain-containing protein, partial [Roseiflexaceae bacterium]
MAEDISGLAASRSPGDPHAAALRELLAQAQVGDPAPAGGDQWVRSSPAYTRWRRSWQRIAPPRRRPSAGCTMDTMIAMAGLDFTKRVPVGDGDGILDAVAMATNLLNEELHASTVSKAYVDNIIESMIDPLIVVEPDATIRIVNRAALALAGYRMEELVGQPLSILFVEEDFD